jgi:hypothetical protein
MIMNHNQELNQLIAENPSDGVRVRGFFRVQIEDEQFGTVGDSGWRENQITNLGFLNIVKQLGTSLTGSKHSHLALGSGGAPAAGDDTLAGEVEVRAALTAASSGSTALQMTATFASSASFVTNQQNISNIGVFGTSSGGTLLSGNTYTSSSCATNQAVNATYTWTFA